MSLLTNRLIHYLDRHGVEHQLIHHKRDYTAQAAAHDTHTRGHRFLKSVIVRVGNTYAMAVVPADRHVDLRKLADWLDADSVRVVTEQETFALFPDCEVGAEPPFGHLYGVPVYIDEELTDSRHITFNGGTHDTAVRMAWSDFMRLVQPAALDLALLDM
ncbi:MAG: YbaK/EbsC family protein [Planctomycetota bacterium]|nr:YbaK/EbsC family protein [Planctomycetota bacterium]